MADLFLIQSDDPEAVNHACSEAQRSLRELIPECIVDRVDGRNWSLITGRNPFVPYAVSSDSRGAAVIIGSTFNPDGPKAPDLRSLSSDERTQAIRGYCHHLNYGMALSIEDGKILVTTDWLGLYPIYYHKDRSTFMVTSVPGLFRCYGSFRPIADIKGLVSILLLAHSSLGLTMIQGVSRLQSGHFLKYGPEGRISEEEVAFVPRGISPNTIEDAVDAFDAALKAVIGEATRETTHSMLLSGGLDSRIIAGYFHRLSDRERTAITLGNRSDIEMRCAVRVASAIGARHERVPVNESNYPIFAERALNEDAMTSGLYALSLGQLSEVPRPPMLSGLLGDSLPGADHLSWGQEATGDMHTFHAMFRSINAWGLSPGIVRELVRARDVDDIMIDIWRQLRDEYYSYPGLPWQRSWWFTLFHRERFMIGRVPKLIALRSWPVLPFVYPDILKLAAATPFSILSDRRVEKALILRKFPELARLPFAGVTERIGYRLEPDQAHLWIRGFNRVKDSLSWRVHKMFDSMERRWWIRVFDFNGAGWGILRDQARVHAPATDAWLDKAIVLDLIPPSSTELPIKLGVSEPTGRRTLIGVVLCCSQYFAGKTERMVP